MAFLLSDQLPGMGNLLRRQLGLTAHFHPTGDRRRAARCGAFLNQGAFSSSASIPTICYMARPVGVVVSMASVSDRKATPRTFRSSRRLIKSRSERPSRSSFQTISVSSLASALRHFANSGRWTCALRSLVDKDALAPRFFQGGKLQVGVLVFGRDSSIADFHEPVLSLICCINKSLI